MGLHLTRRGFLATAGGALVAGALPRRADAALTDFPLNPRAGAVPMIGGRYADTRIWGFDGAVPGPLLRAPQGSRLRVPVRNGLDAGTTVHWHGLRVPNAMDGVPGLTQDPIAPGDTFVYEFDLPDAGTHWYHPHELNPEQLGRGLYGVLIVDEPDPPAVDRELIWVLDDWRLDDQAQITEDFGHFHDLSHAGRFGNTVTVNGRLPQDVAVRAGERIRLRLINAANARHFGLELGDLAAWVIAFDGQPVAPHAPAGNTVVLAPSQRVDLVVDVPGAAGDRLPIVDGRYKRDRYKLLDLVVEAGAAAGARDREPPQALAPNPVAEVDLATAQRHRVEFGGGMMDPKLQRGEVAVDDLRARFQAGGIWTVNGAAHLDHKHEPLLSVPRGAHVVLDLVNDTVWEHPIHLHGHAFRVLSDGRQVPHRPWRDTVAMAPGSRAAIGFVADNPGDWMFHCHIIEHQVAGMMATVRVG
jgi:FtsP/CotA-like multicopper oxidase with cupredoxin domain